MKLKIIKVTNMTCILCFNKISRILNKIIEVKDYNINIYKKEIHIRYTKNLKKILKSLKENGFDYNQNYNIKHNVLLLMLIVLAKSDLPVEFIKILLTLAVQYLNYKFCRKLLIYRLISFLNCLLYFVNLNSEFLDKSNDIMLFIAINKVINEIIFVFSRINTFLPTKCIRFKKVENFNLFNSGCKVYNDQNITSHEIIQINGKEIDNKNYTFITNKKYTFITNKKYTFVNKEKYTFIVNKENIQENTKKENTIVYSYMDTISVDDIIYLRQNDSVHCNGIILIGECLVDESFISGEDSLKEMKSGNSLYYGSIIKQGNIIIKVTGIQKFIEKEKKEEISYYKIFLILMNLYTIIYKVFRSEDFPELFESMILLNLRLCPCIFLISNLLINIKINSELHLRNIVINNYDVVKNIKYIFIDKTGTLTKNIKIKKYKLSKDICTIVYNLESTQKSIYSRAILEILHKYKNLEIEISDSEYISACGIRCKYENKEIRVGKYSFCNYKNIEETKRRHSKYIYISVDSHIKGYFVVDEYIKKEAYNVINTLKTNYEVIMLSGDNKRNVEEICKELGISNYFYNLSSNEKSEIIKTYKGVSCMIGDGFNDMLSFDSCSVSIGVNTSINADMNIFGSLNSIIYITNIIREMNKRKIRNYFISLIYNGSILFVNLGFLQSSIIMYIPSMLIILNTLY